MKSCPPGSTPPLTDLEPADRSSVRQCRKARQFFAESHRLKTFSSITVFCCWHEVLRETRRRPGHPKGQVTEIPEGNKRGTSAEGTFPAPQTPTKEGLQKAFSRSLRIRRTATKNGRRQTGPGCQELCDGHTGPNSRPRSGRPLSVRALRACTLPWTQRRPGQR